MGWPRSAASTHSMHAGSMTATGLSPGALIFAAGLGALLEAMSGHSLMDITPALLMAQTLRRPSCQPQAGRCLFPDRGSNGKR